MNRRLSDEQLERACSELLARSPGATVRQFRVDLRERFGAVGKSARVLATWRSLQPPVSTDAGAQLWEQRCRAAERELTAARDAAALTAQRAVRSEAREVAQQDHWANEIHALREQLRMVADERGQRRRLEQVVEELRRERQLLLHRVAELESRITGADHSS